MQKVRCLGWESAFPDIVGERVKFGYSVRVVW
jgi:hypothetical protein